MDKSTAVIWFLSAVVFLGGIMHLRMAAISFAHHERLNKRIKELGGKPIQPGDA